MRIYPHQQDTGGFFIAVLEKKKPSHWENGNRCTDNPRLLPWESMADWQVRFYTVKHFIMVNNYRYLPLYIFPQITIGSHRFLSFSSYLKILTKVVQVHTCFCDIYAAGSEVPFIGHSTSLFFPHSRPLSPSPWHYIELCDGDCVFYEFPIKHSCP